MKGKIILASLLMGTALLGACSSDNEQQNYGYAQSGYNTMATLPPAQQQALIADMQANPGLYQQLPNESYAAYQSRIGTYAYRWMTPEQLRNVEYRNAVSTAAVEQAAQMGLAEAKANNQMWDEAVKTERAQARIWDARADTQRSKRNINRDKVGTYSDTTHGVSSTVSGAANAVDNTNRLINNVKEMFHKK